MDTRPGKVVLERLVRMVFLDTGVFEEVRDDERELGSALIVTGGACLLAGLGAWLHWEGATHTPPNAFVNSFLLGSLFLAAMYGAAALLIYVMMVQFFRVQVDLLAIVRTMGYAAAPLALSLGMFLPVLYPVFALMPLALLLVAMIYAVQAATGAEPLQVVVSCLIGFGFMVLVLGVVAISSSGPDAPIGAGQFGLYHEF
ncbi:MAG: hypothetical protein OXH41_09680 [Chloroflexi bacterium]|nr:hypothetical protein [Chloroflexota bacterium]